MPYEPTTPPSGTITTTTQVSLDTYNIHELSFQLDPDDSNNIKVRVEWSKGYMNEGSYVDVERKVEILSGTPVLNKMGETPSGETMWDAVKTRIWGLMDEEDIIETGSIT